MSSSGLISAIGLRGSVNRLLKGDIRESDLHDLFFSMRAESGGRGLVSEIANFIAHPDRRTQGIIVREVRDFFAFLKVRAEIENRQIITNALPAHFHEALRANMRRIRKKVLIENTGLNRALATIVLEQALSKLPLPVGGALFTRQEIEVFKCVASNLKGGAFFTDHDLFEDFCRIARKLRLLDNKERGLLRRSKTAFTLFALTVMHNKIIDLGNNDEARLAMAPDLKRHLAVYAFSDVKGPGGMPAPLGSWLFATNLPIATYCEPDIAPLTRGAFIGDFQVTANLKLALRT
jgi:hypothetical protein